MFVREPFERWHEPDGPACRARRIATDLEAGDLVVVERPEERQGLILVGVQPCYRDVEGTSRRGRGVRHVAPRWTLETYRAFEPMLRKVDTTSERWRMMITEFDAAPRLSRREVAKFVEILEAIDEDAELKRAIVAVAALDQDREAVVELVEQWARDRARASTGEACNRSKKSRS